MAQTVSESQPVADVKGPEPATISGGHLVAKALKAEGIDVIFTLGGPPDIRGDIRRSCAFSHGVRGEKAQERRISPRTVPGDPYDAADREPPRFRLTGCCGRPFVDNFHPLEADACTLSE